MPSRKLSSIIADIDPIRTVGGSDPIIRGLAYDSREVGPGFLFYALEGLHTDGHLYVDSAIARGAVAIIHSRPLPHYREGIVYLQVASARLSMSPTATAYFGHPSRSLAVIGVTGTEGKSSTVFFIYQLLDLAGYRAGFISTVLSRTGAQEQANPKHQTTPEAPELQGMLAEMRDNGMEFAVVEASSHGLSSKTGRLAEVEFDVGVMTNVTHEHLEFHGSWEQYRSDKANLFRTLDRGSEAEVSGKPAAHRKAVSGVEREVPAFGVVNADDASADYFKQATSAPVYDYSTARETVGPAAPARDAVAGAAAELQAAGRGEVAGPPVADAEGTVRPADLAGRGIEADSTGVRFEVIERGVSASARLPFPGSFNVANILAALLVVSRLTGRATAELLPLLPRLRPLPGRMTKIDRGQPFDLHVDYAHTPSSFETVLRAARAGTGGRLIALFGSAGERDTKKRRLQGEVADRYCDLLILADEDPRGEEPMAILEEIAAGISRKRRGENLLLIPDRLEAIRSAFRLAAPGDHVLLLGKGHESTIIYSRGAIPWDEVAAAERCLAELGYATESR